MKSNKRKIMIACVVLVVLAIIAVIGKNSMMLIRKK